MDVESYEGGFLAAVLTKEGEAAAVGAPVALLASKEADIPALQCSLLRGLDPAAHLALGRALRTLLPENLLVIYDDIDLAPGWIRIRPNGSAGTHNGMRSIVSCIGTEGFSRLRVGTGGCPPEYDLADWVLSHYNSPDERKAAYEAYQQAADAVLEWMRNGTAAAMNRYNTRKPKLPKPQVEKPADPAGATE